MRRLFRFGLTARLVLLTIIAVLPALAIQAYNEYDLRQAREHDIRERVIQVTRQFGEEMGEIREGARQLLVALARLPSIVSFDHTACNQYLAALKASYPNYESLSVADTNGKAVCSSSSISPATVADLPFFKRAMAENGLVVGNYWLDPASGAKIIHFAMKFSRTDGTVAGVVYLALDLKWLAVHLADRGLEPTASILIADREGYIISRLPNPDALIGKNMRKSHEDIMDGNQTGWEEAAGVDGLPRIYGFVPPALPPGDLFLSAGLSKVAAFADIDRATHRGIGLILAGLLVALAAAVYGGKYFIRKPIQDLTRVTADWRDGNYDARARPGDPGSEIGQLTVAFNEMAGAVTSRQTAQKKAEEDLFELASTLEERVEKRTQELALANRVKSQFLANMSHEIRTPMNGVLGMLELLLEDDLSPKHHRLAQTAFRSGESLLNIVNGVLDLSKIEAGKLHLNSENFNLQTMVEEAVELFAGAARSKKINLAHLISQNTPHNVVGDEGRVRQILTNVLGNAVKFTSVGEVVLFVGASDFGADRTMVEFRVRDTGIGIPEEKQKEIFDAFSQADGSTTRLYGGTGLGLNIARQLCEMMGGSISVESQRGHGAEFRFSVVVGKADDSGGTEAVEHWPVLKGKSALIVDDNPTNLEILENYLTRVGVRSRLATNSEEAFAMLRESADRGMAFDFALIDKVMPTIDGSELARRIRADRALSGMRIVLLSSSDDLPESATAEAERWLMKPVRRAELYESLSRTAAVQSAAAPAESPGSPAFAGCRVLLVEDNEVNMMVSRTILIRQGCLVTTAADGMKALTEYDNGVFDIILMDCQMPVMDGFEATASIRSREAESHLHTPIVALTANAIEGDRELCLRAGMDDYLSKPVSRNAMRTMLERWYGERQKAGAEHEAPDGNVAAVRGEGGVLCEEALGVLRDLESDGDPGIIQQVMRGFLDNAPDLLEELRQGSENRDARSMRTASHTLKSTSAVIGAVALSDCCARLESLARDGSVDEAMALVGDVVREYQSVKLSVEALVLATEVG